MSPIMVRAGRLARGLSALAILTIGCTGTIGGEAPGPARAPGPGRAKDGKEGGKQGDQKDGKLPGPDGAGPQAPATGVVPAGLRRLTKAQYQSTIRDLLGPAITLPRELDRDDPDAVFGSVGGYRVTTSPAGVVKYDDASYAIARQVFADAGRAAAVLGCDPRQGAACAQSFVRGFGRKAWRRPLTDEEVGRYTKVVEEVGQTLGALEGGFEYALAGILQSPHFLYVAELGESDGGRLRFTGHEMATRLSYLLTGSLPDPALAAAADRGELVSARGLRAEIDRLLASPGARPALIGLFGELFTLRELDQLAKDPTVYPAVSPALFASMREEAERLIGDTVLDRRNALFELFDLRRAFVNPALATHYGLAVPAGDWDGVALPPESERAGLLTTGAWLSILAKPYSSSPTYRGVFVREKLLCQEVPSPPPDANNDLPPPGERTGPPATTRQVLEQHRKDPVCATCHAFFDPIGVAFERFDGVGAHRTKENGLDIDTGGELDGKRFGTAAELVALLRSDPRVGECLLRHVYHYVSGHQGTAGEDALVARAAPGFRARGDLRELLGEMLTSDWFRYPGAPL